MPQIDIPEGVDPLMHLWTGMAPKLAIPAAMFTGAVYADCSLSLREFEAARFAIANANDCAVCLSWRSARDAPKFKDDPHPPDEEFYSNIGKDWEGFTERERLCADFAERFATDHLSMGDPYWQRMRAAFTDDEIVELGLAVGSWLAFGRLQRVLGVDACRVPQL